MFEQELYPDAVYAFKHPLTQEVAYHSQLGERRAAVHAAVARAVEALDPERLDERAALLAQHWESARRAARGCAMARARRRLGREQGPDGVAGPLAQGAGADRLPAGLRGDR